MENIIDFKVAQDNKEHERKEAKLKDIKRSFKAARKSTQPKSGAANNIKNIFNAVKPKQIK